MENLRSAFKNEKKLELIKNPEFDIYYSCTYKWPLLVVENVDENTGKTKGDVKFSYLLDPGQSVHKKYSQRDMPTVLVIDSEGVIQARVPWVGADQLVKFLKKFL